jgi:glutaredoxin 3
VSGDPPGFRTEPAREKRSSLGLDPGTDAFPAIAMQPRRVRLFIKPWCPWCHEALDWLDQRGIPYEKLDVTSDPAARQEMLALTGQTRAPSIEVDGRVLADFGADELEAWWAEQGFDSNPR